MKQFWNFSDTGGECVLRLESEIASESWYGDEVTPQLFRDELNQYAGRDVTVWINSPGGDVVAASVIYTALKEHSGRVTVKIDGIAASAASVVAMAGDMVYMSPTAMLMIHDPATFAYGNAADLSQCIDVLNEFKESIINAYALKSGLSRSKIGQLMAEETWINAKKAVELGFADKVLYTGKEPEGAENAVGSFLFSKQRAFVNLAAKLPQPEPQEDTARMEEITRLQQEFEIL